MHPVWNEFFSFNIESMDLSYLRVSVYAKNAITASTLLAETIIPLRHLRYGYRSIPLKDIYAHPIDMCSLLCHFDLTEPL